MLSASYLDVKIQSIKNSRYSYFSIFPPNGTAPVQPNIRLTFGQHAINKSAMSTYFILPIFIHKISYAHRGGSCYHWSAFSVSGKI